MKTDIDITAVYPHPVERVWAALASSDALAVWLMPDDFNVFRRWREEAVPARGTPSGRAEPPHTTHGSAVPKEVHDGAHES